MNYPRMALAAVAAFAVSVGLGFLVNDVLLADLYLANASALRTEEAMNATLPIGIGLLLPAYFAFAYIYAKGYEGGNGVVEGARFGALLGVVMIGFAVVWQWVLYPISNAMGVAILVVSFIETVIYGAIVGAIYRPLPARSGAPAAL